MKRIFLTLVVIVSVFNTYSQSASDKEAVNQVATSFLSSFKNHDFSNMKDYAVQELNVINPAGMWWKNRNDVQKAFLAFHQTFLKNASMTEESRSIRFIDPDVAIVNLIVRMSAFYPPDGVDRGTNKRGDNRAIATMVVVKQNGKWLLTSAQNTTIDEQAAVNNPIR
jgi:uncharacterized protein (TIGR02246 family)